MAWYDDTRAGVHVVRYKSAFAAWKGGRAAAARGWVARDIITGPARVAVGRTISKALLTAGVGLIVGGPARKGGALSVTYVRSPEASGVREK